MGAAILNGYVLLGTRTGLDCLASSRGTEAGRL